MMRYAKQRRADVRARTPQSGLPTAARHGQVRAWICHHSQTRERTAMPETSRIIAIGNDLANVARMSTTLARFGDRFAQKVFDPLERAWATAHPRPEACFAQCWAAKEAAAKALGTGLPFGAAWRDIALVPGQVAALDLRGWAGLRIKELTPPGFAMRVSVTTSASAGWAEACVIFSAVR